MAGTRPTTALKDSIVDFWEMLAVVPRTNQFIPSDMCFHAEQSGAGRGSQNRDLRISWYDGDREFR